MIDLVLDALYYVLLKGGELITNVLTEQPELLMNGRYGARLSWVYELNVVDDDLELQTSVYAHSYLLHL